MNDSGSHSDLTTESTSNELRKTGISVIGNVRWGTHFCYFYETKQDLLDTLLLYFKAGLENKEFCLWVVSQPLTVDKAKRALGKAAPDLDRHLANGDLEIRSHDEWYLHKGRCDPQRVLQAWREKLNQALAKGYAGLRASGDGGWTQNGDWMVFREYEKQVDALIGDQRRILLCTYPLTMSSGDQVFDLACTHQVAVARRHGRWEMVETPELKKSKAAIARLNDELERKVEERTRELARINKALRAEIAERKLAEETVKQAEDRIRLVIDTIPTMAWSLRPDGVLDFLNQRWLDYTGLSLQEAIEEPTCTVHPEDLPRVMEKWLVVKETSEAYEDEMRLRRADGEYRWFLIRIAPLLDDQGNLLKRYGVSIDIEDRKRVEEALRESETRFRQVTENISEVFWLSNPEATLVHYVSPAYEKIWGRSCASLYAEPMSWIDSIHLDDREPIAEAVRLQPVRGKHDVTYRIVRPDGSLRWIRDRAFPVYDESGKLIRVTGIAEDITERKEAEERLRRSQERFRELAENIDGVVWLSDPLHKELLYISPAYERIWGRTCASMYATPRSWAEALHPNDRERILELRGDDHLHEMPDMTYRIVRPDGSLRWLHSREFPVKGADGKIVRVAGIVEDITERKRAELALDERLRFETLLTELSAAFANLPTTTVDQEIDKWLQNIVEFLDLDRAAFDQVGEDGMTLSRSHSHTGRSIDPLPLNVADDQTPWITEQLLRGNTVKWSRIPDEIPEQASKEKEFARRIGAKSVLSIPVCIGGSVICAISFTSMRIYHDWPDQMVARLRLVGEIFANAIARKRAAEALSRREAELNEAQRLASIGSWEWDILADGVTCSSEVRRIYGLKQENQNSPDRPFSKFVHPDDRARRGAAVDAALKGGPPYDVEFRIIRPDKSVRFVHSRGRLIYDDAGKPVRMLGMTQDITERRRAAKELEEANHQLRLLSRRLFEVQEEERRHLARELHDEIGQALTAAKINLQSVTGNGGSANFARLQETTAILDRLLGQVRQISLDLRPSMLDDLGLVPALRSLLDQQGRRASVEVRLSAENIPEKLDPEIQTTCFRIAQEAITNALRHAGATRIDVDLQCDNGKFRLLIRDNGTGFDAESAQAQTVGLGLIGIQERAALVGGQARIISSPKKGTTIEVSLPLVLRGERAGRG